MIELDSSGKPVKNKVKPGSRTWGARLFYTLMLLPFFVWGIFSLWWGSWPHWVCVTLMVLYILTHTVIILMAPKRRVIVLGLLVFLIPLVSFFLMQPSNDRNWKADSVSIPYAEINGDTVTLHNVRNCDYKTETDFVTHFETRTYDLSKLRSVDWMLVDWGLKYIAHAIVSFGFEGDQFLSFSIEMRKEKGESYSAIKGFFRQYELLYIVGDERDLVRLRTNFRIGEDVYLYRLQALSQKNIHDFLMGYINRINQLHEKAEWYNALTQNCMTSAFRIARQNAPPGIGKWHWSIIVNGFAARHAYENKTIDTALPFDELQQKSLINERAIAAGNSPDFSKLIRLGMPGINDVPGKGK